MCSATDYRPLFTYELDSVPEECFDSCEGFNTLPHSAITCLLPLPTSKTKNAEQELFAVCIIYNYN